MLTYICRSAHLPARTFLAVSMQYGTMLAYRSVVVAHQHNGPRLELGVAPIVDDPKPLLLTVNVLRSCASSGLFAEESFSREQDVPILPKRGGDYEKVRCRLDQTDFRDARVR